MVRSRGMRLFVLLIAGCAACMCAAGVLAAEEFVGSGDAVVALAADAGASADVVAGAEAAVSCDVPGEDSIASGDVDTAAPAFSADDADMGVPGEAGAASGDAMASESVPDEEIAVALSEDVQISEDSAPESVVASDDESSDDFAVSEDAKITVAELPADASAADAAVVVSDVTAATVQGVVTSADGKLKINGTLFSIGSWAQGLGPDFADDSADVAAGGAQWNLYANTGGVVAMDNMKRSGARNGGFAYSGAFEAPDVHAGKKYSDVAHTAEAGGSFSSLLGSGGTRFTGTANVQVQRDPALGSGYSAPNTNLGLAFAGADDRWRVAANSNMLGGYSGRSLVRFGRSFSAESGAGAAPGSVLMKTDFDANQNDGVYGASAAYGATQLSLQSMRYNGIGNMRQVLLYAGGDAKSTLMDNALTAGGVLDSDAWRYMLDEGAAADSARDWLSRQNDLRASDGGLLLGTASPELWYTETTSLFDRLGTYKDADYGGGAWTALSYHEARFGDEDASSASALDSKKATLTVGYDKKFDRRNGAWYHGVMLGYGREQRGSVLADAGIDSFHTSLYSIYKRKSGFYVSSLAKFHRSEADLRLSDTERAELYREYARGAKGVEQRALGMSMLTGKRFNVGDRGWYWEPQAQLSYMRLFGDDYIPSGGPYFGARGTTSLRSRTGISLSKERGLRSGTQLDLYADIALNRAFSTDDIGYGYTGELQDVWSSYGVGLNWRLSERSYLDGSLSYGDGYDRAEPVTGKLSLLLETH